jgi:hypothetical protein
MLEKEQGWNHCVATAAREMVIKSCECVYIVVTNLNSFKAC